MLPSIRWINASLYHMNAILVYDKGVCYHHCCLIFMSVVLFLHCLEVKREYYQNCSVLDCVTQCSQSAAHLYEQFLQVQQIGFVTLGPLRCV